MENIIFFVILMHALIYAHALEVTVDKHEDFKPEQIHISFGEKPNDIIVTWSTKKNPQKESRVRYGAGNLNQHATGKSTLFVDGGSLKASQFIHRVELKDLKFKTDYDYIVETDLAWSDKLQFRTTPEGENWAVNAVVFGDLGVNGQSVKQIIDDVMHNHYDTILHVGDIAYNMFEQNGTIGDQYLNQIQSMASKVPYMVSPGNHEEAYNFSHYKARFSMPSRDKYENMFYSFNLGPIHFISINTEAYYDDTAYPGDDTKADPNQIHAQYNWLKNDLEESTKPENRNKHPWIILYGHRTMLCSNSLGADRCMKDGYEYPHRVGNPLYGGYGLEVLLKDYGVDLSIWAHQHSYERLWPQYNKVVYNGSLEQPYLNPRAPVHVITGAAGSREGTDEFVEKKPVWSAFRNRDYGYARITVMNRTHLFFEQVLTVSSSQEVNHSLTLKDKIIDSFWLVRHEHKPFLL